MRHPNEKQAQAVLFLRNAVACYARLGITVKRLLTDKCAAFRSRDFRAACVELGIKHSFTRPYRPQTNGKAERFIQSALREWAYGWTYQTQSNEPMPSQLATPLQLAPPAQRHRADGQTQLVKRQPLDASQLATIGHAAIGLA